MLLPIGLLTCKVSFLDFMLTVLYDSVKSYRKGTQEERVRSWYNVT